MSIKSGMKTRSQSKSKATAADRKGKRKRSNDSAKKDYGKTINTMMNIPGLQLVLKCCLEYSLEHFAAEKAKRIRPDNRKIYKQTLEDYLIYINK